MVRIAAGSEMKESIVNSIDGDRKKVIGVVKNIGLSPATICVRYRREG
jgi:hypothetical protein